MVDAFTQTREYSTIIMKRLIVVCLITCFMLSACSSRLVYNNADYLVKWWVGKYIDFNDQQQQTVDSTIDRWLSWHRQSQIPLYQAQLQTLRAQVSQQSLNREAILAHFADSNQHIDTLREYVAPDVAKIGMTLDLDQLSQLFATIKHERAERQDEYQQRSQAASSRVDRITERMAEYIGAVTPQQVEIIRRYEAQLNYTYPMWQAYGDASNQRARSILLSASFNPNAVQQMQQFVIDQSSLQSPELQQASQANKDLYIDMLWAIFSTLSSSQRAELVDKIDEYLSLLEAIG